MEEKRLKGLVLEDQRGQTDWLYWSSDAEWTSYVNWISIGYCGTERINRLEIKENKGE